MQLPLSARTYLYRCDEVSPHHKLDAADHDTSTHLEASVHRQFPGVATRGQRHRTDLRIFDAVHSEDGDRVRGRYAAVRHVPRSHGVRAPGVAGCERWIVVQEAHKGSADFLDVGEVGSAAATAGQS